MRLRPFLLVVALLLASLRDGVAEEPAVPPDEWLVAQSGLCSAAIVEAEKRHHLPAGLLESIARAESGRPITAMSDVRPWPWTIDAVARLETTRQEILRLDKNAIARIT